MSRDLTAALEPPARSRSRVSTRGLLLVRIALSGSALVLALSAAPARLAASGVPEAIARLVAGDPLGERVAAHDVELRAVLDEQREQSTKLDTIVAAVTRLEAERDVKDHITVGYAWPLVLLFIQAGVAIWTELRRKVAP